MLIRTLIAAAATAWLGVADANWLRGPLADVGIVDRATGEQLAVYWHRGERWIAGKPGHRYSITLASRHHGRLLAVLSVDGVNAISGETAAWDQGGYVFGPGERAEIRGWRKSQQQIAAFEFTALADSYAARTGRPDNVGVIGVALFREAVAVTPPAALAPGAPDRAKAEAQDAARADGLRGQVDAAAASRLGTGHGRGETSIVGLTHFQRAQPSPDQVITIRYDSRENLIAMGIIAGPPLRPNPFPATAGFVPDPPPR